MAEVFAAFETLVASGRRAFAARACGAPMDDGMWQGWIEFVAVDSGETLRTSRETTQPNRTDLAYWAGGLSVTYLEGALNRALQPRQNKRERTETPTYDEPAPRPTTLSAVPHDPPVESILDPFEVYENGEFVLRQKLGALASWHLVNIARAYDLTEDDAASLAGMSKRALVDLIVAAVMAQADVPSDR
jgi:hypothetical protein